MDSYEDIQVRADDEGILWITLDRPDNGNMFRRKTCLELVDVLQHLRTTRELRVAVLTGAGDRFFCLGGEKEDTDTYDYSSVLPIVDVYELLDTVPKPIIAAVNGFAVGGGHVLHVMCDLTVASEQAVFRQVGPVVGSYDAGYGTWYLEEMVGRKRAKEIWYLNRKYSAEEARQMGLVNDVVPHDQLLDHSREVARTVLDRGPQAIAALKSSFAGRHTGVAGQARIAHDLLLTQYLRTDEAAELSKAFSEKRSPDRKRFDR